MRKKRYFWNMKHHRELDRKMGLSRQMAEPLAKLAAACGMDTELAGTFAMYPICIFSNRQQDICNTFLADVNSEEYKRTYLLATVFKGVN